MQKVLTMRFDAAKKFEIIEDSNGFITAQGVIASVTDKLVYRDGIETIHEDALFKNMDEWEGLPLTLSHPSKFVTPETAPKTQVGSVVKVWRKDGELWAKFKVTTKKAIDAVRNGLRGLSAGYEVALQNRVQIARQNNHLALVSVGRAPSSGIRADERFSYDNYEGKNMAVIKFPNGKEIKLDCSDAEAELMQNQVDTLSARADDAEKNIESVSVFLKENFDMEEKEDMDKKLDALKSKIADMKEKGEGTEKLQAQYDALFEKMEKSKGKMDADDLTEIFDIHEKALKLDSAITIRNDGKIKTSREIAEEALKEVKLDGKTDEYVFARLDFAIENADSENVKNQRGDANDPQKKGDGLTVQQKADQKFYTNKEG